MEAKKIKKCNILSKQLLELEYIQKNNFDNFCVGIYCEDYSSFKADASREIINRLKVLTSEYYQRQLSCIMVEIKKELNDL